MFRIFTWCCLVTKIITIFLFSIIVFIRQTWFFPQVFIISLFLEPKWAKRKYLALRDVHYLTEQQLAHSSWRYMTFLKYSFLKNNMFFESPLLCPCRWVVKNSKEITRSSLVIDTFLASPAISGAYLGPWEICKLIINPLKFPGLPTQPQMSFSVSWVDFFVPLGFFPSKFY